MIDPATLCAVALSLWTADAAEWYAPRLPAMRSTCEQIAEAADARELDSALIVSIAWEESRFRWVTSSAGAAGPLQALPSLWCDGGTEHGCDLIAAGLDAFEAWSSRFAGRRWETVCSYNGGNRCGVRAVAYADRVLDRYHDLIAQLSAPAGCPGC